MIKYISLFQRLTIAAVSGKLNRLLNGIKQNRAIHGYSTKKGQPLAVLADIRILTWVERLIDFQIIIRSRNRLGISRFIDHE